MARVRWATIRRIWITTGITATVIFVAWSLIAFRASGVAREALRGDAHVAVTEGEHHWGFEPRAEGADVGVVFFPGGMVDPVAYAPMLRDIAAEGYPALLIQIPRRGIFGGAEGAEPLNRAVNAMRPLPEVRRWVVAGHSRGGEIASRFAHTQAPSLAGLVLIGTSHPRDISLAHLRMPVTRIYGTRDTVADVEKLEATKKNLPPHTQHLRIDGGNHSQFGSYGFQPGDWPATVSREEQHRQTRAAILDMLQRVSAR